jgi:hypothetical protein
MASNAAGDVDPSELRCPVCRTHFTQPKLLPCGHVLCRKCVVTCLQSKVNAQCPTCCCPVLDEARGRGVTARELQSVADALPTDLALAALCGLAQLPGQEKRLLRVRRESRGSVCGLRGRLLQELRQGPPQAVHVQETQADGPERADHRHTNPRPTPRYLHSPQGRSVQSVLIHTQ